MDALSGIHIILANACFWMLAARPQLIVSNHINTITPPTIPPRPVCLLSLQLDTLLVQIKSQAVLFSYQFHMQLFKTLSPPNKPVPQLIVMMSLPTVWQCHPLAHKVRCCTGMPRCPTPTHSSHLLPTLLGRSKTDVISLNQAWRQVCGMVKR